MNQWFHNEQHQLVLLINSWRPQTSTELVVSLLVIALMCFFYECCRSYEGFLRYGLQIKKSYSRHCSKDGIKRQRILRHVVGTFMFVLQMMLGYFIMLLVMTYQYKILLTVSLTIGASFFVTRPLIMSSMEWVYLKQVERESIINGYASSCTEPLQKDGDKV